ncbi:hypothetical protein INT48_006181 [Thamnidium elegans]|uniref:Uncharacterized protein n=1 Tax=Thamnidium elegans TaxID=101142 RepID=A0A8H7VVG6_9FUNG|nr:hypothetical protein INT48_006181 [Thamnidium elegans]
MEWIQTKLKHVKYLQPNHLNKCHLFGCEFHHMSLVIDPHGEVYTTDQSSINLKFPQPILQVVGSCHNDLEICHFYFRSVRNQVFEWTSNSEEPLRKRAKLDENSTNSSDCPYKKIASNIHHIMPFHKPGVLLFSDSNVKYYNPTNCSSTNAAMFYPNDVNITCHQYFDQLDTCIKDFFSLNLIKNGLFFGTEDGSVYCRNLDKEPIKDTRIIAFENSEPVIYLQLISGVHNSLMAMGDRGTIMIYSNISIQSEEPTMLLKQFNIQGPIHAVEKSNKVILIKRLRMTNRTDNIFDSLSNQHENIQLNTFVLDSAPTSIENDPQAIIQLTNEALDDFKLSELDLKYLDQQEQNLSQKLSTTNQTLYALQTMDKRRKPGTFHSLDTSGFELTICPITRSESIANHSLQSTCYLRTRIKTSRFLQLEDWYLELDLFRHKQSKCLLGETKTVPVMAFETIYQNGIERYSVWQRDIQLDLERLTLPIQVSVYLTMSVEEHTPAIRFPVSNLVIDDLHFMISCSPDFIKTIQIRGLDQVSNKLMYAYCKQILCDKTTRYPFARLLKTKSLTDLPLFKSLFDYKSVHIRCLIDLHTTDKTYKSILSSILNEGKTMDEMKSILLHAEQALFTIAAFPACPVIIELTRVSSTMIDFCIQCVYSPALFRVEASFISRLLDHFIQIPSDKTTSLKYATFLKTMKSLEHSILELQETYQLSQNNNLVNQLKTSIDLLFDIYNQEPIGYFSPIHIV